MNKYKLKGDSLLVDIENGIATLTLNRPDQRNALSKELRSNITHAIRAANTDDDVGVVILTGAGEQAFSAGLDLKELDTLPLSEDEMGVECDLMQAFAALTKPVIAAVNGVAVAGGLELVMLADIAIACQQARFADTHARVGILPAWGATQYLPMLVGPARARYLSLTGNYIDADTAKDWGLILDVVPADELMQQCLELASTLLECDAIAMADIRRCINHGAQHGFDAGLRLESELASESVRRFRKDEFAKTRNAVITRGKIS